MVGEVSPLLPLGEGLLGLSPAQRVSGLLNTPQPQFQQLSPGVGVAQNQSGINLSEIGAGLSILQGGDIIQAIGGLLASQRQAKQDALKREIIQREEAREVAKFQAKQAAAQRQQAAQQGLAAFIQGNIPAGSRQDSAAALFQQALSGVDGAGDDLAKLLANEPIIQNDQFLNQDVVRGIVAEAGILDVSQNKKQLTDQARQQAELGVSQGNLAVSRENLNVRKQELERQREADIKLDTAVTKIPQPDGSTRTVLLDKQTGVEIRELGQGFSTLTSAGELPASRADEVQASRDMLSGARTIVSRVRRSLIEAPARGGLVGTVKKGIQTFTGIASDFLDNDLIGGYLGEIANDITDGRTAREVGDMFDPELPRNQLAENQLAYALARARKPVGRINVDDVNRAAEDTKITGLFEAADIKERMKAIDEEFERAITDIDRRLKREQPNPSSDSPGGVPRFKISPDGTGLIRID